MKSRSSSSGTQSVPNAFPRKALERDFVIFSTALKKTKLIDLCVIYHDKIPDIPVECLSHFFGPIVDSFQIQALV